MAECEICEETDDLIHTCNHCSGKFCPTHTLPENHHCPALRADAVGPGEYNTESGQTDGNADNGEKVPRRDTNNSVDFESGPNVAKDGSIADTKSHSDGSEGSENRNTVARAVHGLKRGLVGGFVSPHYRGRCPNCDQYVSETTNTGRGGILCCKNCGWMPGYPLLRQITHRFNWVNWKRRASKGLKITFVLIIGVSIVSIFGTGFAPIDNAADSVVESAGLDDNAERAGSVASDVANSSLESSGAGSRIDERRVESLVHRYVNQERQQHGVPNITHERRLRYIARNHSEDMAEKSYFQHEDLSGDNFADRYEEAGYKCRVQMNGNQYATGGENIAQTWFQERIEVQSGERYYDSADDLARGIVNQWMNSPGHRQNILREYWQSEGIGIEITDSGKVYATQNFC